MHPYICLQKQIRSFPPSKVPLTAKSPLWFVRCYGTSTLLKSRLTKQLPKEQHINHKSDGVRIHIHHAQHNWHGPEIKFTEGYIIPSSPSTTSLHRLHPPPQKSRRRITK